MTSSQEAFRDSVAGAVHDLTESGATHFEGQLAAMGHEFQHMTRRASLQMGD